MNTQEHYDSYRASVKKDLLPGAVEFSKQLATKRPEQYPTVYDYLAEATGVLQKAAAANDEAMYKQWITGHQNAMRGLLERFVASLGMTALDLMLEKGWRHFRFSKEPVRFTGEQHMVWMPNYASGVPFEPDEVFFDAIELEKAFGQGKLMDPAKMLEFGRGLYDKKKAHPGWRFLENMEWMDVGDVNTTKVEDWTGRLFLS